MSDLLIFLFFIWFIGFLCGKIPLTSIRYKKWIFNRRNIPYYVSHILEGNKIIHTEIIPRSNEYFEYKKSKYCFSIKDPETKVSYVPHIDLNGEYITFHNKNNINPLKIVENALEPGYNDPERFAALCSNRVVSQSLIPNLEEFAQIKRFILICTIVVCLAMTGIVYLLVR
jgi:hypothetical protein